MGKIGWFHISDLHFGIEKQFTNVTRIRENLISYIDEHKSTFPELKYLFISGDIISIKEIEKAPLEDKFTIINDAAAYVDLITSELGIEKNNVFIVPGNHDTDRTKGGSEPNKKAFVEKLTQRYSQTEEITSDDINTLGKSMHYYSAFISKLSEYNDKFNYCSKNHKFIRCDDIDVILLNTALTSCEKNGKIIIGDNLIQELFDKRSTSEDKPLIILAHHRIDDLIIKDQTALKKFINEQSSEVIYLCGHYHFASADRSGDFVECICGTTQVIEKIGDVYHKNDANVLIGTYNKQLEETKIYFYHYDSSTVNKHWVENRAISDEFPYNVKSLEFVKFYDGNFSKKKIFNASSETDAHKNFFSYLLESLPKRIEKMKDNDAKISKYLDSINGLLDSLNQEKPQWGCFSKYKEKPFVRAGKNYGDFDSLIEEVRRVHREYQESSQELHNEKNRKIFMTKLDAIDNIGILLYSKSTQVTDFLKSLDMSFRKKCTLYVCSGDVRSKKHVTYEDAVNITQEFFDRTSQDFSGYTISLVPDIYISILFKQKLIHAVIFGAHKIYYSHNYTHFSNTIGSGLVYSFAKEENIPCFIVADNTKATAPPLPEKTYDHERPINAEELRYGDQTLLSELGKIRYFDSELVSTAGENNTIYLTDKLPWDGRNFYELKEVYPPFADSILKDRRVLTFDGENDENIIKEVNAKAEDVETVIIGMLNDRNLANSPHYVSCVRYKSLTLTYYKGIRVYNFLVAIDKIISNTAGEKQEEDVDRLKNIALILLNKCEKNQEILQSELYNAYKKGRLGTLDIYPHEKINEIIWLFFKVFNISGTTEIKVKNELDQIYQIYKTNAVVPFRDASTKNMILYHPEYFAGNWKDDKDWEERQLAKISEDFQNDNLLDIVKNANVIDVDFSSCNHLTTFSDDTISFRFHQRTEKYYDWQSDAELWNGKTESHEVVLATYIIRYLRFGGRKALYRILQNNLHAKRFKYDDELFYFRRLIEVIEYYENNNRIAKGNLENTKIMLVAIRDALIYNKDESIPNWDDVTDKDIIERFQNNEKKNTYIDIFPY